MKKLLPQANNIERVIDVFVYVGTSGSDNLNELASFCNFDRRQASYYLNACFYLNLIDENANLTKLGKDILSDTKTLRKRIYETIISDELISKVFARYIFEGKKEAKEFAFKLLKEDYSDYSDAVIERRISTILNWCEEAKINSRL